MAYDKTNPPALMVPRVGNGIAIWAYKSADAHTVVAGANYFSNGSELGMRVGDVLHCVNTGATTPGATSHAVSAVTGGGAATVNAAILA